MRRLAQSTAYTLTFKAFLDTDHVSAATGKTIAITISKAGGAFGNPAAGATNATEMASGWYSVPLGTGDTGTLGDLIVRGTNADIDDAEQICQVVSATTGGLTNLDAAVSTRSSHAAADVWAVATRLLTAGTNIVLAKGTGVTGFNDLSAAQVNTEADTALADYDGPTHTELTAALAAADDATLAAIAALVIPSANANADALLDRANGIETGMTPREMLRGSAAVLFGKASGGGSGTETFRNAVADSADRIVSTNDAFGNRTAVTANL